MVGKEEKVGKVGTFLFLLSFFKQILLSHLNIELMFTVLVLFFKKILLSHLNIELMFTFLVLFSRERWDTKRQGWERRRGFGLDQDGHSCGHHCESVAPPRFGQIVVRGDRHRGGRTTTDRFRVAGVLPGRGDDDRPSLFGGVQPETGQTGRV